MRRIRTWMNADDKTRMSISTLAQHFHMPLKVSGQDFPRHLIRVHALSSVVLFSIFLMLGLSGCSSESLSRSDTPLGRTAAMKQLGIPLPASAHDVYYLDFAGGMQDLERFVRFDVAAHELDSAVDALIADNNKMMGHSLPYPRAAISAADLPGPRPQFDPMKWWDPGTVTKGYYRGSIDAHALRIIVDEGRSRIYLYQND